MHELLVAARQENEALGAELLDSRDSLAKVAQEATHLKAEKHTLIEKNSELSETNSELSETNSELSETNSELSETNSVLRGELEALREELEALRDELRGYEESKVASLETEKELKHLKNELQSALSAGN